MRYLISVIFVFLVTSGVKADEVVTLESPDKSIELTVFVAEGQLKYNVKKGESVIVGDSELDLTTSDGTHWGMRPEVAAVATGEYRGYIFSRLSERAEQEDNYNHATITLRAAEDAELDVMLRLYGEGFAVKYAGRFGAPTSIKFDGTTFDLSSHNMTVYTETYSESGYKLLEANTLDNSTWTPCFATSDRLSVTINEAGNKGVATKATVGIKKGVFTVRQNSTAEQTDIELPWRYLVWGETPVEMIEGKYIMTSLNEAADEQEDYSWIVPGKVFRSISSSTVPFYTDTVIEAIDFARDMNFQYVLLDAGWYGKGYSYEGSKDSNPLVAIKTLDMELVCNHAADCKIGVITYVNNVAWTTYNNTEIFKRYAEWGVSGIKMGFVDGLTEAGMQKVYSVVDMAADYEMVVNVHDNMRPTGVERLKCNLLTMEGIKGNEHEDNTSVHTTTLPFTRFMSGPADYTFCFQGYPRGIGGKVDRVKQSKGHQMALSVIYFSPLQHIFWYGKPWWYKTRPEEVEFFKELVTVWDDYRILEGEPGEYFSMARRSGERWFVGVATNKARQAEIPLTFVEDAVCNVRIFEDDGNGGIVQRKIKAMSAGETVRMQLADNGGAVAIVEACQTVTNVRERKTGEPDGVEIYDLNGVKVLEVKSREYVRNSTLRNGLYIMVEKRDGTEKATKVLIK